MPWRGVFITNKHGVKLAGLLRASPLPGKDSATDQSPPLVIVCHGFTGSKEGGGETVAMADELAQRGFDTLLFDFTGCGESEGQWEEISLTRQVDDLRSVVDWARSQGYKRIVLNGRSFGGATVIAYGALDQEITAICTWAAVARPLELFTGFCAEKPNLDGSPSDRVQLFGGEGSVHLRRGFFQDLKGYDLPKDALKIAPRPLLLIHGTGDQVVPIADARLLYGAAKDPKDLVIIEDGDHTFSQHSGEVWEYFFSWLLSL